MAVGATARRGIDALGNLLRIVGTLIVLVLVLHIVLTLLEANPENGLTSFVRERGGHVQPRAVGPVPARGPEARGGPQLRHRGADLVRDHRGRRPSGAPSRLTGVPRRQRTCGDRQGLWITIGSLSTEHRGVLGGSHNSAGTSWRRLRRFGGCRDARATGDRIRVSLLASPRCVMRRSIPTRKRVHPVDEVLPPGKLAVYGFQHVLAFYAGAVIVPILLAGAIGLSDRRAHPPDQRRPVHLRHRLDHPVRRVLEGRRPAAAAAGRHVHGGLADDRDRPRGRRRHRGPARHLRRGDRRRARDVLRRPVLQPADPLLPAGRHRLGDHDHRHRAAAGRRARRRRGGGPHLDPDQRPQPGVRVGHARC